jgi:predicted nucleotidyltransferase
VTIDDVAFRVAEALNQGGFKCMLVGGFSSNFYGIPRSTKDADFVVHLSSPLNADFARLLGPEFEAESQLSFETNPGTQRQEFRVRGTVFKVEVFRLSDDPHDQERFQRATTVEVKGSKIVFPTAEDVIVWKLRWARPKDRDDIRGIISVQQNKLDCAYIETGCARHGTRERLDEIRKTVPRI